MYKCYMVCHELWGEYQQLTMPAGTEVVDVMVINDRVLIWAQTPLGQMNMFVREFILHEPGQTVEYPISRVKYIGHVRIDGQVCFVSEIKPEELS